MTVDTGVRWPRHALAVVVLLATTLAWFAPVMFSGKIFITDNYLGAFYLPVQWWSDLLFSGFPLYADLNFGNTYPLRVAFSSLAGLAGRANAYNFFVWSAYFIAGLGAYVYVFRLTLSRSASLISGLAFAFSTFMQAHVGHETMTHSAAWLPWIIWATHRIVKERSWRYVAALALFGAMMYLANHPEIFLQVVLVSSLYAVWLAWREPDPAARIGMVALAWLLTVPLVAWQLSGALEYALQSDRMAKPRVLTLHGALPLSQLLQFAMPWAFGAPYVSIFAPVANFGYDMAMEVACYVAAPVFTLATVAMFAARQRTVARFWTVAAVVFLVLALGPRTLLGEALFFTPGFRMFNIPGRYVLTVHFAMASLCGIGAACLSEDRGNVLRRPALWLVAMIPVFLGLLAYPSLRTFASDAGVSLPVAWKNVTVVLPFAGAVITAVAIVVAARMSSAGRTLILTTMVVTGCAYFGWFAPWRLVSGPQAAMLEQPAIVTSEKALAAGDSGRVLAADGWLGPLGVGPNQSMLFGLKSISGYGPLLSHDYAELTGLTNAGWIRPSVFDEGNAALDVTATRWVFPYSRQAESLETREGVPWNRALLGRAIGGTCAGVPLGQQTAFRIDPADAVRRVAIVTTLGCGLEIPAGATVAYAVLQDGKGQDVARLPIRAGSETAEATVSCAASAKFSRHGPASVFDAHVLASGCLANDYVALLPVDRVKAERLRFEWALPASNYPKALMQIERVTVVGEHAHPIGTGDTLFADSSRWKRHAIPQGQEVYENLRARPLAWVVGSVYPVSQQAQAIGAVRDGRLPDGTPFDASRIAVVETGGKVMQDLQAGAPAPAPVVRRWASGDVAIEVAAVRRSMLVISQRFYPGWKATVDGSSAPIRRVDGILQGVELSAGKHQVELRFAPTRLPWLCLLAGLTVVALFVVLVRGARQQQWDGRS